jgi:hypothetical protein
MRPKDRERRFEEKKRISRDSIGISSLGCFWLALPQMLSAIVFSDLGPCVPNGRIQAEHLDGVR